ncbi:hypothetical protein K469DRAFT_749850 [Zopfia rhizophila CBS 207.26]|uniref:FAD-binding domain-containing protein n=1 Tax=Zopfia rhizophila CBS 207.26 TaxID=1314779 RepID=A0A6A6E645_9PEZI|nr:hypothetical protein K469DRAFT_749850 [Zopfia rhizophila CBS 207.26]
MTGTSCVSNAVCEPSKRPNCGQGGVAVKDRECRETAAPRCCSTVGTQLIGVNLLRLSKAMVFQPSLKKYNFNICTDVLHNETIEHETPILVVGAGPSGLIAALQLARKGVKCMLVERNLDTTRWPKMDVTNCRSMELFNRLGISKGLREQGVPQEYSFDVIISTGLSDGGEAITKWELSSPDEWRERIQNKNDGSMPREPYQRCSQAIFEAWLKPRIQAEPLIHSVFGLKLESLIETADGVESSLVEVTTGQRYRVRSRYVIGCDGAGSRVRKAIGGELIGGPVQGQFWHIFFTNGAAIISQDEVDTWTAHLSLPLDVDWKTLDPIEVIYEALGGSAGRFPIRIDKILVTSSWRPNICVADCFTSASNRIFLSGDAAHQNIPTGGYGMNTAVGDSFDIAWKLAAVLQGYGGEELLRSYEIERLPVAVRNIDRSGVHASVHFTYVHWAAQAPPGQILSNSNESKTLRSKIAQYVTTQDGENKEHGIEMGYRYNGSPIVVPDPGNVEPPWEYRHYIPSTWPGARAPHIFLADNKTSIYDFFGPDYTIVDFSEDGLVASNFEEVATRFAIPLKKLHLPNERHAHSIWERQAVLVRPDDHVAWRAPSDPATAIDVEHILKVATGQASSRPVSEYMLERNKVIDAVREKGFAWTVGNVDQDTVKGRADFQK